MLMTVLKVLYVVIAIVMIAFILLQRGAGAQQGGGFGAGASATVFGASGSANFLSRSTKWLAVLFFGLSIAMAAIISHGVKRQATIDAGVMSDYTETPAAPAAGEAPVVLPATGETPAVPAAGEAPAAPAADAPAAPAAAAPAAPASDAPAASTPTPASGTVAVPAEAPAGADKPAQKGDN